MADKKDKINNKDIEDNSTYEQIVMNHSTFKEGNTEEEVVFKINEDNKSESEIEFYIKEKAKDEEKVYKKPKLLENEEKNLENNFEKEDNNFENEEKNLKNNLENEEKKFENEEKNLKNNLENEEKNLEKEEKNLEKEEKNLEKEEKKFEKEEKKFEKEEKKLDVKILEEKHMEVEKMLDREEKGDLEKKLDVKNLEENEKTLDGKNFIIEKNLDNKSSKENKKESTTPSFPPKNIKNEPLNIFSLNSNKPVVNSKKSSSFLDTPITKNEIKTEEENVEKVNLGDKIFENDCVLYKFIKKWEKISTGTILVYKQEMFRILFIKNEFLTVSFDFFLDRDVKPYIKNRGVGFIANGENVLVMFDDEKKVEEFFNIINK